jgi:DNA polymerase
MNKIKEDLSDEGVALGLLKQDCLSCRRCGIGGKRLDGMEWLSSQEQDDPEPISNVFSTMNLNCKVMVVGQNPGSEEVVAGLPFVGPSGKVFDQALMDIVGMDRKDVYVTNVVKCYTNQNRKPTQGEIDNCRDFLDLEIKILKPKIVVALGSFALKAMTGMSGIMKHCGDIIVSPRYLIPVVAMIHPSPYNMNSPERNKMFLNAMKRLASYLESEDG